MSSFYGGLRGESFIFQQDFPSIAEMYKNKSTINYHEYIVINCPNKTDPTHGNLYQRVADGEGDSIQITLSRIEEKSGFCFISNIAGPAGAIPKIIVEKYQSAQPEGAQDFEIHNTETSVKFFDPVIKEDTGIEPAKYRYDATVKQSTYNTVVDGKITEAHIGLEIPRTHFDFDFSSVDNEAQDVSFIDKTDNEKQPLWQKYTVNIPRGKSAIITKLDAFFNNEPTKKIMDLPSTVVTVNNETIYVDQYGKPIPPAAIICEQWSAKKGINAAGKWIVNIFQKDYNAWVELCNMKKQNPSFLVSTTTDFIIDDSKDSICYFISPNTELQSIDENADVGSLRFKYKSGKVEDIAFNGGIDSAVLMKDHEVYSPSVTAPLSLRFRYQNNNNTYIEVPYQTIEDIQVNQGQVNIKYLGADKFEQVGSLATPSILAGQVFEKDETNLDHISSANEIITWLNTPNEHDALLNIIYTYAKAHKGTMIGIRIVKNKVFDLLPTYYFVYTDVQSGIGQIEQQFSYVNTMVTSDVGITILANEYSSELDPKQKFYTDLSNTPGSTIFCHMPV